MGKPLMPFQSETPISRLLRCSVDEATEYFKTDMKNAEFSTEKVLSYFLYCI